jgi:hypothetical protein
MNLGARKVKRFYFVLLVIVGLIALAFSIAKLRDEIQAEETLGIADEFVEYGSAHEKR